MHSWLYGRAVLVQPDDLTAKARIRGAALELFARQGVASTSVRSIAARARVSPSLVVHHFGSKSRLRDAVDDAVIDAFGDALRSVDVSAGSDTVTSQLEAAVTGLIGGNQPLRDYLAHSLLEAGPASHRLFGALMDLVDAGLAALDAQGRLAPGTDETWRSYTVAFVILGPVLLRHQIDARLGADAFDRHVVSARSTCNRAILQHGLFR